jgi:non-ribosomal peptide synthetase component F
VAVARRAGIDLFVGWLAILKAGAAYVPIDLADPEARGRGPSSRRRAAALLLVDAPHAGLPSPRARPLPSSTRAAARA